MLRLGLFLYDRIGGRRTLPGSRSVSLRKAPHRAILKDRLTHGFEYSDCWVEDSRMAVLAAMDARELGAEILTRTECIGLERTADGWIAALREPDAQERVVEARAVVNAAGPWVDGIAGLALGRGTPARLRLVKGSHIIVPRLYKGAHAYIFQQEDGRIVFAIPYEHDYTLIGTTDEAFDDDPGTVAISKEERAYLREAVGGYFRTSIAEEDIVSTYSGVRPLYDDHADSDSTVTRDYVFELDAEEDAAPILSIYGGKITTFRKLAEHALEKLSGHLPMRDAWTKDAPLPGGDMADFEEFLKRTGERHSWLPPKLLRRLVRAYGTRIDRVIGTADGMDRMGEHFGGDLYEAELRYLASEEFARTAEDVLWRRSKLGLHVPDAAASRIDAWFAAQAQDPR
jgi:glycerol-3-phosphate dehydrogenase